MRLNILVSVGIGQNFEEAPKTEGFNSRNDSVILSLSAFPSSSHVTSPFLTGSVFFGVPLSGNPWTHLGHRLLFHLGRLWNSQRTGHHRSILAITDLSSEVSQNRGTFLGKCPKLYIYIYTCGRLFIGFCRFAVHGLSCSY